MKNLLMILVLMFTLGVSFGQVDSESYQQRLKECINSEFPCCGGTDTNKIPAACCWVYAANSWITVDNSDKLHRLAISKEMRNNSQDFLSGRHALKDKEGNEFYPSLEVIKEGFCSIAEDYYNLRFEPINIDSLCKKQLGTNNSTGDDPNFDCHKKGLIILGYDLPKIYLRYNCIDTFIVIPQEEMKKILPKEKTFIPSQENICDGESYYFFGDSLKTQDYYVHDTKDTLYYLDLNVKDCNPTPKVKIVVPCDTCYNDISLLHGLNIKFNYLLDGRKKYGDVFSLAPYKPRWQISAGYSYLFPKDKGLFKKIPCLEESLGASLGLKQAESVFLPEDECDCQGNEPINQSIDKTVDVEYGVHWTRGMRNQSMKKTGLVISLYLRFGLEYNKLSEIPAEYENPNSLTYKGSIATRVQKSIQLKSNYIVTFVEGGYEVVGRAPYAMIGGGFPINIKEKY